MAIKVKIEGIRFKDEALWLTPLNFYEIALQVKFCFLIDSHKKR